MVTNQSVAVEDPLNSKNEINNRDPQTPMSRIKSSLQNFKFKVNWHRSLLTFKIIQSDMMISGLRK